MEHPERGTTTPQVHHHQPDAVTAHVPDYDALPPAVQARLREMAADLLQRGFAAPFVKASLLSTAEVLKELQEDEHRADDPFRREGVRRFIEANAVPDVVGPRFTPRRERRREERDRLQTHTLHLIRQARSARGRHEVKKTRSMLLKVDQRELRRELGREGEEMCRQINTWLRSTAPMFS
jgi:hypothetical protein